MRFSLILATVGRVEEPKSFLASLDSQTYRDFELIVVDQNPGDRLEAILQPYRKSFSILHLRSAKGLSRARNVGLKYISGDIVAFPDDDCWYPPDLLRRVFRFFQEHPDTDGLTGCSVDESGELSNGRWDTSVGVLDRFNVWRRGISFSIFLKTQVVREIANFDETLGAGARTRWGSGEETDYLLRALKAGFRLYYDPSFAVYHPRSMERYDESDLKKALRYGCGMGRVLRKHRYPLWFVAYYWLRPLGGAILALGKGNIGKARYYWATLKGRFFGWGNYR